MGVFRVFRGRLAAPVAVAVPLAATILAGLACGDVAERLQADVVASNILLDVGDPFGIAPRKATVVSRLASITGSLDDPSATPIAGANVTMTATSGASASVTLAEQASGTYVATSGSGSTPTFVYASNASYTVTMVIPSGEFADTYTTTVTAPPRTEVTGLPDPLQNEFHPVNTALTMTIVGTYDYGLVIVLDENGDVVYDSRPKTVQEAVDLALGDFDGTITIPAEVFPTANTTYGIIVAGLESAPPAGISPNLQILTRFFAGSSKTAVVITGP